LEVLGFTLIEPADVVQVWGFRVEGMGFRVWGLGFTFVGLVDPAVRLILGRVNRRSHRKLGLRTI